MRQILVVAGVIMREGKILLAKRPSGDSEGGKWEFPGGKVEPGEDPRDALLRELREELGVETEAGPVLEVISVASADRHLVLLYFACDLIAGEPVPLDHAALNWFLPREVADLAKPPADTQFWSRMRHIFQHD